MSNPYDEHNEETKANFDHVYDLPDPRGYFEALGSLGYLAPEHGRRLFPALLRALPSGGPRGILDLCCSYGVNAALLRHDLTLDDLYAHYGSPQLARLPTDGLLDADRAFYAEHETADPPAIVGLDSAANAVQYALRAGLLDAGFGEDLEEDEPSEPLRTSVGGVGLIIVTGGVGYVWVQTFDRLLRSVAGSRPDSRPPWVATLPTRIVDYRPLSGLLSRYGLVTEKLSSRTFPQRRFADAVERETVLGRLKGMGVDPTGKEEEGWYHADFYLSRPETEARGTPIEELLEPDGPDPVPDGRPRSP